MPSGFDRLLRIWHFPSIENQSVHPFKAASIGLPFNRFR